MKSLVSESVLEVKRKEEKSPLYQKYAHMADDYDIIVGYIVKDRMYQVLELSLK